MNDTTQVTTATKSQRSRGRPVDPKSSLTKARAVFESIPVAERTRKNAIAQFQTIVTDNGNLSKDTAAAYYSVIMRKAK